MSRHVQVANKFAALEVIEGEKEDNNQLDLVENNTVQRSAIPNPSGTRKVLNPAT